MRYDTKIRVDKWSAVGTVWVFLGSLTASIITQNPYWLLGLPIIFGAWITVIILND